MGRDGTGWHGMARDGTGWHGMARDGTGPVRFRHRHRPVPLAAVPPRPASSRPVLSCLLPSCCPAGSRPSGSREGTRRGERTCGVRECVFSNCWGTHFPTRTSAQISGATQEWGFGYRAGFWVKLGASVGLDCESDFGSSLEPLQGGTGGDSRDKTCREGRDGTGPIPFHSVPSGPVGRPVLSRPLPSRFVPPRPVPSRPVPSRPVMLSRWRPSVECARRDTQGRRGECTCGVRASAHLHLGSGRLQAARRWPCCRMGSRKTSGRVVFASA